MTVSGFYTSEASAVNELAGNTTPALLDLLNT